MITYFSMTTLSKVGYGDFYAMCKEEELVVIGVLFFSMIVFSVALSKLIHILQVQPSSEHMI